jgi:outer membrane protein
MIVAALAAFASTAFAAPADEVRAMVEAGRGADAYARCNSLDPDTEPAVDLWCGIAAVDAGRAVVGVLALERYTLRFPDDTRARLELARAYFYAGDDRRARAEFEAVLATDPPAAVRVGIQRYLDALLPREGEYTTQITGFVEAGGGYDSNANAGVSQADIGLPVLGPVTVVPGGVKKGDGFAALAAAIQINHPVAPGWWINGSAWGNGTFYGQAHDFDLANLGVALGGRYQAGRNVYALTYAHAEILLDGSQFRRSDGVALEWRRMLSERDMVTLAPQYARVSYSDANTARNADYGAVGVGYRRWWLTAWQPVMNVSAYGGEEHNREGFPFLGRKLWGASADVTVSPSPYWALTAGGGYQRSNYDGSYPIIDTTRHDDNWFVNVGATYLFARHWSVRLEYQYTKNNSNLALFDYDRDLVAVKVRYDFR